MGCLALGFYVNSLAKEADKEGRKGTLRNGQTGGAMDTIGAKENPAGVNLRGVVMDSGFTYRFRLGPIE
jgi:hypothetical protein